LLFIKLKKMQPKEKSIFVLKRYIAICNGFNLQYVEDTPIEQLKKDLYNTQWWFPMLCAREQCNEMIAECEGNRRKFWVNVLQEVNAI